MTIRQSYAERDAAIFAWSETGMRQKAIAQMFDLSEYRIKAIIAKQRKITKTN
jgi:transposase